MSAAASGLDWAGLMRAGMQMLRLHPDQFWALTPAELGLMLGIGTPAPRMSRNRLADLAARFPDAPAFAGASLSERTRDQGHDDK